MEDEENIEDELFLVESQLQDIQGLITLSTSQLTCRINFMHKVVTPTWLLLHPRPRKRHALLHRSSVQIRRWYDCYCDASIWVLLMQPAPLLTKPSLTCNLMCRPSPSSIMQEKLSMAIAPMVRATEHGYPDKSRARAPSKT
jgi:hypothetical protein